MYFDTTALIDLGEALTPSWQPPPVLESDADRRRVALARFFFYASRHHPDDGRQRSLYCSEVGRRELAAKTGDWTEPVFMDLDRMTDAPPDAVAQEAARLAGAGLGTNDAHHLAVAALTPWIDLFVTDDRRLRTRGRGLVRPDLRVLGAVEALATLAIKVGDEPQTGPHPTNPLHGQTWWLPGVGPDV